jgi:hypothetical protein
MDPLELVRSRNRADIELPSGYGATIGLTRVQDAVLAGFIPVPVLKEWDELAEAARKKAASNGKSEEAEVAKAIDEADPSPDAMISGGDLRREMVRRTLKRLAASVEELEGPEIDMPMAVIAELSQEDFDVLAGYAMREVPFPAASLST